VKSLKIALNCRSSRPVHAPQIVMVTGSWDSLGLTVAGASFPPPAVHAPARRPRTASADSRRFIVFPLSSSAISSRCAHVASRCLVLANSCSCAACSASATAPCSSASSPSEETSSRGWNGERARSSRSIGSSSRSPLGPIPPPRSASSGWATGTTDATASASHLRRDGTALPGRREDPPGVERPTHAEGPRRADDARGTERRLERPASTVGRVVRVRGRQGKVADLPRGASRAAVELPTQDQAHPHAGPDVEVHEVLHPLAEPVHLLADRGEVHIVLERRL